MLQNFPSPQVPTPTKSTHMNTQEKLELIRQKCIEANPDLGDLAVREYYREPRLADVLLTMNIGEFTTVKEIQKESSEVHTLALMWNLYEDDLSQQSPETIDFIHQLLT